jgi:hypothetical protein
MELLAIADELWSGVLVGGIACLDSSMAIYFKRVVGDREISVGCSFGS